MKRTIKRAVSALLAALILLTAAPVSGLLGLGDRFGWLGLSGEVSALDASGSCGDNVSYTFDSASGLLTIYGTGDMYNYGLGSSPFCEDASIKSVVIESGVTSIGESAFRGCTSLTSITIPNSVTSIGDDAFYGCTGLTSITLPDSVTSIGNWAFYGCTGLTRITIPDSVTSIGESAFRGCTSLTNITIPDSVKSIGRLAFYGTGIYNDESNWENDVLYIGNHLIYAKKTIAVNYTVKSGTKTIADDAFYSCIRLKQITIPDSVTSIGERAFLDCTGLTNITILVGVTSIGCCAFDGCEGLTNITLPDSVTSIGERAFEECTGLTSITIPDSVTSIGRDAFYGTGIYNDESNWENDVLYIGNHLIYAKKTIAVDYTVKSGTKTIADDAFRSRYRLTSITLPDSVTSIGDEAFDGCKGLTSITIPDSVTSIGNMAFDSCSKLTDVYYGGSEEDWNKIVIYSYNDFLENANIHYDSYGENTGKDIDIPQDIVFLDLNEHYTFTVYDEEGNDITDKLSWVSITSIGSTGEVEIVNPGEVKATKEGLTSVLCSYWDENEKCHSGSCDIFVGKPNSVKYKYCYDTKYYYGENAFYSDAGQFSDSADIYIALENALHEQIDFLTEYDNYSDELSTLDIDGYTLYASVSGSSLSFDKDAYINNYISAFNGSIPISKAIDELLTLYPYNLDVSSEDKSFTVTIKIESEGFETITDSFSFKISSLEKKEINEHISFADSNVVYKTMLNNDFATGMSELQKDAQYIWSKYSTLDFENYHEVLMADILVQLMGTQLVGNISLLPVLKEWKSNYNTILGSVSTMVEDTYAGSMEITDNLIDKIIKKSKYTTEGMDVHDEVRDFVVLKLREKVNIDKINKAFAAIDKTGQCFALFDMGVNITNDIADWVDCVSIMNSYQNVNEEFKNVIKKVYDCIPNDDWKVKEAVNHYVKLDTTAGYTQEVMESVIELSKDITLEAFNSIFRKQFISMFKNAIGSITLKSGALLSSTTAFSAISTGLGALSTGAALGLCISDILCNNSGQAEEMGKVVAASQLAPYVIQTLKYYDWALKNNKDESSLKHFEVAFNLAKALQIYSIEHTYKGLEKQANSIIIKLFSKRDYPGAMSELASLKTSHINCNCCDHISTERVGTKTIEIRCPVNVFVYDENGTKVVEIIHDKIEYVADDITAFVYNSHKYITVPSNKKFSVEIIATDSGAMSYSITEYDESSQRIRTVNNENIPLSADSVYYGQIEEELSPNSGSYKLECNGKEFVPNQTVEVPVTGVSVSVSDIEMKRGDVYALNAVVFPADATDSALVWSSDDESVAKVDADGVVKAVGAGTATITVRSNDGGYIAICNVTVPLGRIHGVSVYDAITLNCKKSAEIHPQIDADEDAKYTVTYSSSNEKVARVDENGNVTALRRGTATITCTVTDEAGNTVQDSCSVTVKYTWLQWLIMILLFGWIWY